MNLKLCADRRADKFQMTDAKYQCLEFDANSADWDQWLRSADHAGATQISAHLSSFQAYRATVTLHLVEDKCGQWLAGTGLLSWHIPGLGARFGIGVGGPCGSLKHWPLLLDGISGWCRQQRYMCLELSPHLAATNEPAKRMLSAAGFVPSPIFAPVSGLGADLRVSLRGTTDDDLMRSFRRQTRQHVVKSLTEGYQNSIPTSEDDLRSAIAFMHSTSLANNIPFGPLGRFTDAVLDMVRAESGYAAIVSHHDQPLAAGVFVRAGQSHSCYRLATKRDQTHRRAAYFLHWHAMQRARDEMFDWYYMTGRSTPSVHQFKRGFRPEEFDLLPSQRLVLRPGLMRGIETVQPIAIQTAKQILSFANRVRGRG